MEILAAILGATIGPLIAAFLIVFVRDPIAAALRFLIRAAKRPWRKERPDLGSGDTTRVPAEDATELKRRHEDEERRIRREREDMVRKLQAERDGLVSKQKQVDDALARLGAGQGDSGHQRQG